MDASIKIRIPIDLKTRAERVAERSLISLSDVARQAIKTAVETEEAKAEAQATGGAGQQAANGQ